MKRVLITLVVMVGVSIFVARSQDAKPGVDAGVSYMNTPFHAISCGQGIQCMPLGSGTLEISSRYSFGSLKEACVLKRKDGSTSIGDCDDLEQQMLSGK